MKIDMAKIGSIGFDRPLDNLHLVSVDEARRLKLNPPAGPSVSHYLLVTTKSVFQETVQGRTRSWNERSHAYAFPVDKHSALTIVQRLLKELQPPE